MACQNPLTDGSAAGQFRLLVVAAYLLRIVFWRAPSAFGDTPDQKPMLIQQPSLFKTVTRILDQEPRLPYIFTESE